MERRRTGAAAVALALALVLVVLSACPALSAVAVPWVGSYRIAVLGGSQSTSWMLDGRSTGPCDAPATGRGTDATTFFRGAPTTTEAVGIPGHPLRFARVTLALAYAEARQGAITTGTPAAYCLGAPPAPAGPPDCGITHGRTHIDVGLDPSAPLLREHYTGVHFDSPYVNCPVAGVVPPQFAGPLNAIVPALGVRGPDTATATLTADQPIATPGYSGSTRLDLRLSIRRLGAVEAMRLRTGARPVVGAAGRLTLPLSCPATARCRGSVALTVGIRSAPAAYRVAPAGRGTAVAVARFRLRGGRSGVRIALPGGRALARRLARRRVDVIVTEASGAGTVTYDVGTVRL